MPINQIIAFFLVALIPFGTLFLIIRRKRKLKEIVKNRGIFIKSSIVRRSSIFKNLTFIEEKRIVFEVKYKSYDGPEKVIYAEYFPLSIKIFDVYEKVEDIPGYLDSFYNFHLK